MAGARRDERGVAVGNGVLVDESDEVLDGGRGWSFVQADEVEVGDGHGESEEIVVGYMVRGGEMFNTD